MDIVYDSYGRMQYNPIFHPNHLKRLSEEDRAYIAKFYDIDGAKSISMALGRTEKTIAQQHTELKKKGLLEYYKNLWDKQFKEG